MENKQKYLYYLFLIGIALFLVYLLGQKIQINQVQLLIEKTGVWGPVIYILLLLSTYIIAPLSGTPVVLAGFFVFGKKFLFYVYLANILSAVTNFWISRIWGRKWVSKLVGKRNMAKIDQLAQDYGLKSLIFLKIFQGYLHDFISYAYGLTNIKFLPYLLVSLLAPLPWYLFWYLVLLPKTGNITEFAFYLGISIIPFTLISLFLFFKYRQTPKTVNHKTIDC